MGGAPRCVGLHTDWFVGPKSPLQQCRTAVCHMSDSLVQVIVKTSIAIGARMHGLHVNIVSAKTVQQ